MGRRVIKVITGYGMVELYFDSKRIQAISDEIIELPVETEEPTDSPGAESENNLKDYFTEILLAP